MVKERCPGSWAGVGHGDIRRRPCSGDTAQTTDSCRNRKSCFHLNLSLRFQGTEEDTKGRQATAPLTEQSVCWKNPSARFCSPWGRPSGRREDGGLLGHLMTCVSGVRETSSEESQKNNLWWGLKQLKLWK